MEMKVMRMDREKTVRACREWLWKFLVERELRECVSLFVSETQKWKNERERERKM